MKKFLILLGLCFLSAAQVRAEQHNVILFVADGLRPGVVNEQTAPTMAALMKQGTHFANTHSMFPTFTTANASALSTGHKLGDTGDYSNTIYTGFLLNSANGTTVPFLEVDGVIDEVDDHFGGDYMNQDTVMKAARQAGLSTATIGKLGPALIFDHTDRNGGKTIVIDDSTGRVGGVPLNLDVAERLAKAGLPLQAPKRTDNAKSGTKVANDKQQKYFVDATTKAVLPLFKERGKPFMLVYWSRDPDGTQHAQGDSINELKPGINGETSMKAIRDADDNLAEILAALKELGLDKTTDVIVTSDHGFSTISKESKTSFAAQQAYKDVKAGFLPRGFVAIDLAHGLNMPLLDPDAGYKAVGANDYPSRGNGMIGGDREHPKVIVAANGGSDLIYIPDGDRAAAKQIVDLLAAQDYVSGLFVSDELGPIPGTLPISDIDLKGTGITPVPAIVVNFRTFATDCADPLTCGVEIADTALQQGQGMHGSFSRADTMIVGAAVGPDFKSGFVDTAPSSNADIGKTMAHILGLNIVDKGSLIGRVLTEAMPGGAMPECSSQQKASEADANGIKTVVAFQACGPTRYFDAAGYPGRTLGLPVDGPKSAQK